MLFIDNKDITDPAINLALEEYSLRNLPMDDSYLLFYINEPSIIIGKNQNTIEEINTDYVDQHHLHIVRRLSGGGAVYHDLGNLNFSFLTKDDGNSFHNFAKFTQPVIEILHRLGVEAVLTGRNDIQVGEQKFPVMLSTYPRGECSVTVPCCLIQQWKMLLPLLKSSRLKLNQKALNQFAPELLISRIF